MLGCHGVLWVSSFTCWPTGDIDTHGLFNPGLCYARPSAQSPRHDRKSAASRLHPPCQGTGQRRVCGLRWGQAAPASDPLRVGGNSTQGGEQWAWSQALRNRAEQSRQAGPCPEGADMPAGLCGSN